jgi:co-chaperonin GroES (HSP10)
MKVRPLHDRLLVRRLGEEVLILREDEVLAVLA